MLQKKLAAHFIGERQGVLWIKLHLLHFPHWHLSQSASRTRWHFDRLSLRLVLLVCHSFVTTQMRSIIVVSEPVSSCSSLSWSMKDTSEDESLLEEPSSDIIAGGDRLINMHTVWGVCVYVCVMGWFHRTLFSPSYPLQVVFFFFFLLYSNAAKCVISPMPKVIPCSLSTTNYFHTTATRNKQLANNKWILAISMEKHYCVVHNSHKRGWEVSKVNFPYSARKKHYITIYISKTI